MPGPRRIVKINGALHCMQLFAEQMIRRGKAVVFPAGDDAACISGIGVRVGGHQAVCTQAARGAVRCRQTRGEQTAEALLHGKAGQ